MFEKTINKIYNYKPVKKHVSKILFSLKNRPSIDPKFRNSSNGFGYLIVSADFELGWAFRFSRIANPIIKANRARNNFPILLDIFEKNSIPITWATVGHLFLEECSKGDHDWMHKIPYFYNKNWSFDKGEWFDCDPFTNYKLAPQWYAPDLIDKIIISPVDHEIGCHTFSHIDFSDLNCPKDVANDEIKECVKLADKKGIKLESFVAPGGTRGNFDILKKYKFTNYRITTEYELSLPIIDQNGLVAIPTSIGLDNNNLGWSKEYYLKRLKKYIDKAIETGTLCHFWFHPSLDPWFVENIFGDLMNYANQMKVQGKLKILTMGEMADKVLKQTD